MAKGIESGYEVDTEYVSVNRGGKMSVTINETHSDFIEKLQECGRLQINCKKTGHGLVEIEYILDGKWISGNFISELTAKEEGYKITGNA